VQAQRFGERPDDTAGLAGSGGADGEQGGAEEFGADAESGAAVGIRIARVVGGRAEPDLPRDEVVLGQAPRKITLAGRVQAGGGTVLEHGAGERGETVPAAAYALPGAGDAGMVDVAHQPGAGLGGEPFGGVGGSGVAESGPLGGVPLGRRRDGPLALPSQA
jgi:hypothetical protein